MLIPFNKPYISGKEYKYIKDACRSGVLSGNGKYTKKCQQFFENKYGFSKCLLTTSGTDALEMAAILLNIKPGDEVICPSFTFVSTANAFILRGAKIIFIDSDDKHPNINPDLIKKLITKRTVAIVIVHYAGVACDMEKIMNIADKYKIKVVEDAAQAIDSFYKNQPLGSFGHLAALSFHETKNVISGEGGMLIINDKDLLERAEIVWEKGTNRSQFFRGLINKYGWVDIGSSYLPSELIAAFLYAQLENLDNIQHKRKKLWLKYFNELYYLERKGFFLLPHIPSYAKHNFHIFYIVCRSLEERTNILDYLNSQGICAVFHYQALHASKYYLKDAKLTQIPNAELFSNCVIRLPLYYELKRNDQQSVIDHLKIFFEKMI